MSRLTLPDNAPAVDRRLSADWILATILGSILIWPLAGRLLGLGTTGSGLLAVFPWVVVLFSTVILLNRGRIVLRAAGAAIVPYALWAIVLLVSMARSSRPEHTGASRVLLVIFWLGTFVAVWLLASDIAKRSSVARDRVVAAVCLAPAILACVNLALFVFNVDPHERVYLAVADSRMASWFGVTTRRVLFPLARGINNYGVVAGLGLAGALGVALGPGASIQRRALATLALLLTCVVIVLCDSRAALFFGVIAGFTVVVSSRVHLIRHVRLILPMVPALPVLLLLSLSLIAESPLADFISRRPGDIESATGRVVFWGAAASHLAAPSTQHMIGYGQYGQTGSGVSEVYGGLFVNYEADAELMSLHNSALQLIFDTGYLGLLLILVIFWWTWTRLTTPQIPAYHVPLLGMLLFVVLEGTTEATVSLYFPEVLLIASFTIAIASMPPPSPRR